MKKKNKARNYQKRKSQRVLKSRKKAANSKLASRTSNPKAYSQAVEHLANISFKYLQEGVNYHFSTREEGLIQDFIDKKGASYPSFSVGIRGRLKSSNLEVSKPLTWIPQNETPLVRDYLAELWNEELKNIRQINSFTFFLAEDDETEEEEVVSEMVDVLTEDEEATEKGESSEEEATEEEATEEGESSEDDEIEEDSEIDNLLAMTVICSGYKKESIEGYLVLRVVEIVDGAISIEGKNIFLDLKDVFDLHIPPFELKDEKEEESNEESDTETNSEDSESDVEMTKEEEGEANEVVSG